MGRVILGKEYETDQNISEEVYAEVEEDLNELFNTILEVFAEIYRESPDHANALNDILEGTEIFKNVDAHEFHEFMSELLEIY